jgi:hypothetical protein
MEQYILCISETDYKQETTTSKMFGIFKTEIFARKFFYDFREARYKRYIESLYANESEEYVMNRFKFNFYITKYDDLLSYTQLVNKFIIENNYLK